MIILDDVGLRKVRYICKKPLFVKTSTSSFIEVEEGDIFFLTGNSSNKAQLTYNINGINIFVSFHELTAYFEKVENDD